MTRFDKPQRAALATLAIGLLLTGVATGWQARYNAGVADSRFADLAAKTVDAVRERMGLYEYGLRGTRGAAVTAGIDGLDADAYRRYARSRDLNREFPGSRGFGIVKRVRAEDEAAFVARQQTEGRPDFAIRAFAPHAGDRYVITFLEPLGGNSAAVGLDIGSEAGRRSAAEAAMREARPVMTSPLTLVQASGKAQQSFLVLLPIYRPDAKLPTPAAREQALVGWAYGALVTDEVMRHLALDQTGFSLALRDRTPSADAGTAQASEAPFFQTAAIPLRDGPHRHLPIEVYGRQWEAELRATPRFMADLHLPDPGMVWVAGAVVSLLLAWLVLAQQRSLRRSDQLRIEHAHRAAIVESSNDAIVGASLDGCVTSWNPAAERLFGYTAEEMLGHSLDKLLPGAGMALQDTVPVEDIEQGRFIAPFDSVRRRRDGSHIDVSISAVPLLGPDGRVVGMAKTLRDISAQKAAERSLREFSASLEAQVAERTAGLDRARRDLRTLLDSLPSMIGYWDKDLVNHFANHAYFQWFGFDPETMPGRRMPELVGEERYQRVRPQVEAVLRGESQTFERTIERMDGAGVRHALWHYQPDIIDGEVRGFYVMVHDVTEVTESRRKAEAALRDNAFLLSTIDQHSIVSVTDGSGTITEVNDAFCRISGYSREELVGQTHRRVHSGVQPAELWPQIWRTIAGGTAWRGEICNRAKDGTLYWVDSIIAPFLGHRGEVEKYISIRFDITAAKQAEKALRESQAFLERTGHIAGVGGWEFDLRTQEITWSKQVYRIHEQDLDTQPRFDTAIAYYAPEARSVIEQAVSKAIAEGSAYDLELPMTTATGRSIWVRTAGQAEMENGQAVRLLGAFQDITERKQAELALAAERDLMNSLMSTLPDQIYFKDEHSRFLRINPGLARRYGLDDPAEAVGKSDADFFLSEHADRTAAVERRIMQTGEALLDLEEQETWPDRPPTWNLATKMPLRDIAGRIVGTFGVSRDITARKATEEALRQTNERFSLASDAAGLGVWENDLLADRLTWDERMYRLFGTDRASAPDPGAVWKVCLHDDDRVAMTDALARCAAGIELDAEFRILWPSGEVRHLKAVGQLQRDADGRPVRIIGINFDITEQKRAEQALARTASLLGTVLESASEVAIIATELDGTVNLFNTGAERLLGYDRQEVLGRLHTSAFVSREEMRRLARQRSEESGRQVRTGLAFIHPAALGTPQEITYLRKNGQGVRVSLTVTAMLNEAGECAGYLGIAHDVTRQKQYEASLHEAARLADAANLAKSQFLANMSHEIRTPMNAVMGLSYLLARTPLDREQAGMLAKIELASKSLLGVINDILDVTKIEAGELSMEAADFDLPQWLSDVSQVAEVQTAAKRIGFSLELPAGLPPVVRGDALRLTQVLTNLLSNAVKFTHRGSVRLVVQVTHADAQRASLRFEVHDSGIGISPEAAQRLFQPFAQADASTTRRFGGTGLGLSIVRQLVEMMGGAVGLDSMPGEGSCFWAEVSLELGDAEALVARDAPRLGIGERRLVGARVLVVDDSPINLEVARRILELEGAMVELAPNGQVAVDLLTAQPDDFDVVLMDVQMPVLDGLSATRRLRSTRGLEKLPVIALTAGALNSQHMEAVAAGMDDFIGKPFDPRAVVDSIHRLVPRLAQRASPGAATAPAVSSDAAVATVAGWPALPGIALDEVNLRLGGDVALFRSLLTHLLDEFVGLRFPEVGDGRSAFADFQALMHKLKGSAGNVGARGLHAGAGRIEEALDAGQVDAAREAWPALDTGLRQLRQAVDALSPPAAARPDEAAGGSGDAPLDADALARLMALLRQQQVAALDQFDAVAPALRRRLAAPSYDALRGHVDSLRFREAAELLALEGF